MENNKGQELSNKKSKNIKNQNIIQAENKILRSKSKNIYNQKKNNNIKPKIIPNTYAKPKIVQNGSDKINNKHNFNNNNINHPSQKNKYEERKKQNELIILQKLKEENLSLKKDIYNQEGVIKELHNLMIHNFNKINSLRKKYSHLKRYLKNSLLEEDNNIKEKIEEELALRAVEQQIMDEICPNPDKMSYEQLLELEEEVGNVNKGLSKEKINKIPMKPFHKALFDDNSDCIICMEGFTENELVKQLLCGHIFHGDCIDHWLTQQKNCPFCKAECSNIC